MFSFSLSSFSSFFVCGCRRPSSFALAGLRFFLRRLASRAAVGAVSVSVGGRCSGVPAVASSVLSFSSSASVAFGSGVVSLPSRVAGLSFSAFVPGSSSPSAFVSRSRALVSACASAGALWVSFPSSACPVGLPVSSSWVSSGSGSWSSLSLAAGSGCACLVFSPSGLPAFGWSGFSSLGSGWFFRPAGSVQLSLF